MFRRVAVPILLALTLGVAATDAHAVYRGHKSCDPDISAFDDAVSTSAALAKLMAHVDEGWRRLAVHGDPDMRAATRDRRSEWLCEVEQACGSDLAVGRRCIAEKLKQRRRVNARLLGDEQTSN